MKHLVLVGMMGCGKSTVGKELQILSHRLFYDTDQFIENMEETSISEIFAAKGEAYFRQLERKVLYDLLPLSPSIIGTGGGIFANQELRERLLRDTRVYYLQTDPQILYSRVCRDDSRPLLTSQDMMETIERILQDREPFYRMAHVVVSTNNRSPADVSAQIWQHYQQEAAE
jgi:shikimate kinase